MCSAIASAAGAQRPDTARRTCNGEIIAGIQVRSERSDALDTAVRLRDVREWRGVFRRSTDDDVIKGYLFVYEGDRCSETARRDSERLLRSQPFIGDATIRVVPAGRDSVRLEVTTEDEPGYDVAGRIKHGTLSQLRIGDPNIRGRALAVALFYQNGFAYRDGYGARYTDYQAFGRKIVLNLEAIREPHGGTWGASLREAFDSDLHPHDWYVGAVGDRGFQVLQHPGDVDASIKVDRTQWLAGKAWRLGRRQRGLIVGPLIMGERLKPPGDPVVVTDSGMRAYTGPAVDLPRGAFNSTRIGALLGYRRTTYVATRGFDAMTAQQDLQSGSRLTLFAARAIRNEPGTRERDVVLGASAYVGRATMRSLIAMQLDGESRRPPGENWAGSFVSGRAAWYVQTGVGRLHTLTADWAGLWRSRLPAQVTLSDRADGMRGFASAHVGGAQRLIVRAEDRWLIPTTWRRVELGIAGFVETGRLWAGDAPLGVTTPWQLSTGLSVLGATPRGSKRTWRVDFAIPVTRAGNPGDIEIRASIGDPIRAVWREARDVERAREGSLLARVLGMQ